MIEANRKEDGTIENEDIIANVSGVLYAGGADTVRRRMLMCYLRHAYACLFRLYPYYKRSSFVWP